MIPIIDPGAAASEAIEDAARDLEIPTDGPHTQYPACYHPICGDEAAERARSVVGRGTYGYGRGGRRPQWPSPFDALGRGDCSALALAWAWGIDRFQPGRIGGDWMSTTACWRDARGRMRMVRPVPIEDVQIGDALDYPNLYDEHGEVARYGHCALVVGVPAGAKRFADLEVAHCHGPGGRTPAVELASGALWDRMGGIAIRRVG